MMQLMCIAIELLSAESMAGNQEMFWNGAVDLFGLIE